MTMADDITSAERAGIAALEAECLDVQVVDDTPLGTAWCVVQHPEFSTLTTRGASAEQAVERMRAMLTARKAERDARIARSTSLQET
jgi:hypothetical protein